MPMKNAHDHARNMEALIEPSPKVVGLEHANWSRKRRRMPDVSAETTAVAKILYDLRMKRSLTINELAAASELNERHVADLEAARRDPRLTDLVALARALETTVEAILRQASL